MNTSRIAILGMALFAGVTAFFLMMNNSGDAPKVQIVEPVKEETVRVLVATRQMQRGDRFAPEDTAWVVWPKKALQRNFVTDENTEFRDTLTNAVARTMIVPNEPIIGAKVVKAGNAGLMAAILEPGMRAVTIRVSPETSSGGFILPGDSVDVMKTINSSTELMFSEVRVLAVNTIYTDNTETANITGSNVTVELSPSDAQAFLSARTKGSMSLVLRSIFQPEGETASERRSRGVSVIRYGRS